LRGRSNGPSRILQDALKISRTIERYRRTQRFLAGFWAGFFGDGFAGDAFPPFGAAAGAGFPFAAAWFPAFAGILDAGLDGVLTGAFAGAFAAAFAGALARVLAGTLDLLAADGAGLDVLPPLAATAAGAAFFAGAAGAFVFANDG
jgi:hypothetical protein